MPAVACDSSCFRNYGMARPLVVSGEVVGNWTVARTSSGPEATAHTNLVPPASMPAYKGAIHSTSSSASDLGQYTTDLADCHPGRSDERSRELPSQRIFAIIAGNRCAAT